MDEELKNGIKKIARNTGVKVTESILRWKFKKEGKAIPNDQNLEMQSRLITDQAHEIISRSGKNIWGEFKKAYHKKQEKEGPSD